MKFLEEKIFKILMVLCTYSIVTILLVIIFSILYKGIPALNWKMLIETPKGGFYFGKEGGILNAIIGSLYLSCGATILALFISLPVSLYLNVYLVKRKKLVNGVRFLLDFMWGVPSIVYGAFAFAVMIYFGIKTSLLAGIVTVTLLIVPIMVRGMDEVFKTVPRGLLEASMSLGATKSESAYRIFIRQCIPGLITAVLLSFGRAIGDAAAVLFTTGYTDYIPTSLTQQAATLPLSIFFQLGSPVPEVKARAYASAVILTVIILTISILARVFSGRYHKHRIKF